MKHTEMSLPATPTIPVEFGHPFTWDGSDIGFIDPYIRKWKPYKGQTLLFLHGGFKAYANRLDEKSGSISLIADELKPLFGLKKLGRHKCLIGDNPAIITKIEGQESIFTTEKGENNPKLIPYVQKCYVYRWALGLSSNVDSSLWIRSYTSGVSIVTSYLEIKYMYPEEKDKKQISRIPDVAVKKWFGNDWSKTVEIVENMFDEKSLAKVRLEVDSIIRRIDRSHVGWAQQILRRIQERVDFTESDTFDLSKITSKSTSCLTPVNTNLAT